MLAHTSTVAPVAWAVTRIALGFVFLWAFVDKLFGFGFGTPTERAWINGGSPTTGFLSGVEGPFADFFNGMAGQAWADWLFMAGLAGIGIALIAGVAMRIAAASGALMLVFMWLASLPLENNPVHRRPPRLRARPDRPGGRQGWRHLRVRPRLGSSARGPSVPRSALTPVSMDSSQ